MSAGDLIKGIVLLGGGWALWTAYQQQALASTPAAPAYYPDPYYDQPRQSGGGLLSLLGGASSLLDSFGVFDDLGVGEEYDAFAGGLASYDTPGYDYGGFTTSVTPDPVSSGGGVLDGLAGLLSGFTTTVTPTAVQSGTSHDADILARTIWGEARGEGTSGMEAVASVVMNRVADRRWPSSPAAVCQQPYQFSAWNAGDPNRAAMQAVTASDRRFAQAIGIAQRAVAGQLYDATHGATHYYAASIPPPAWSYGATVSARIGSHVFMTGVA